MPAIHLPPSVRASGRIGLSLANLSVYRHTPYVAPKLAPCGALYREVPRLLRGAPIVRVQNGRHRGAHRDATRSAERHHRVRLDDLEAPFTRRPEHRLRDPPIGVARNEHRHGAPSIDGLGRLTGPDSPPRRNAKKLNIHDVNLMPGARPRYYTHDPG